MRKVSEFVSDPAHAVTDPHTTLGARDYRSLVGRKDVLVFDSEPMTADTEVTGPVRAEIYASADVPDFDLWVRLLDVAPDGTAYNLMSPGLDVLRASYRNGSVQPELVKPGEIVRLNLDRLLTSNVFKAGHRIRVQISVHSFRIFRATCRPENPRPLPPKRESPTSAFTMMRTTPPASSSP